MPFSVDGSGVLVGESALARIWRELLELFWEVAWLLMGGSAVKWWCPLGPGRVVRAHVQCAQLYWVTSLGYLLRWSTLYWGWLDSWVIGWVARYGGAAACCGSRYRVSCLKDRMCVRPER